MYENITNIPISLPHTADGVARIIECGVPFPMGCVNSEHQLQPTTLNNEPISNFAQVLSRWPDGSIKWLHLGLYNLSNANAFTLALHSKIPSLDESQKQLSSEINSIRHHQVAGGHVVICGENKYELNTSSFALTHSLNSTEEASVFSTANLRLVDDKQQALASTVTDIKTIDYFCCNSKQCTALDIIIENKFNDLDGKDIRSTVHLRFFALLPWVKIETSIHNADAAAHPQGLWDLGDPGSFQFSSFDLQFNLDSASQISMQCSDEEYSAEQELCVLQTASGGENWQSPVHVDANNSDTVTQNGYQIKYDGKQLNKNGRVTPVVSCKLGSYFFDLHYDNFWQNFPSALCITTTDLAVGLFPAQVNYSYELQGGEKKAHTCWLSVATTQTSPFKNAHHAYAHVDQSWLAKCNVIPWLPESHKPDGIDGLIAQGLQGESNFYRKRELADEFGWRHFGDLYADHETDGYQGQDFFVSHYNNQYDPIYGFLRQFLISGDKKWFDLANDLANHVKDIDIYHTNKDKAQYNGGLFWHTDHYLKAYTATHRSYSNKQESNAYQDHAGGGGPGGQHCYTTGLTIHHLLTGSESSKQAVLTLGKWISHVYEGDGTCLELLLAFKNRAMAGVKDLFTERYPLDRGTANYVIAMLDCYELTQNHDYLNLAQHIIQHTVHPHDNISQRGLENIEACWFYTVMLQAICRYLGVQEARGQLDDNFYLARDTFLHYANWMLENEYPYLEKPEILEYPNHTWTAQDMRKAHIFYAAYYYDPVHNLAFLEKGNYFQGYVAQQLQQTNTVQYTRILALLMQNHGPAQYYGQLPFATFSTVRADWHYPDAQNTSQIKGFLRLFAKRLLRLSISNEINWLKTRLPKRSQ
jgi:hypothetical protein